MILIGDTKYSCIECIRGHRSSLCRHHSRPLLQVRSKGRPTVHANGNPNHRIAVFAEEISQEPSDCGKKCGTTTGGCNNKKSKTPVIILKASPKQVLDLKSGQIVGLYNENDFKPDPNAKPVSPVIHADSFINSSSCCTNGVSKIDKNCGCCTNKTRTVNKSKILKSYLNKHFKNQQIPSQKEPKIKQEQSYKFVEIKPEPTINVSTSENNDQIFDVVNIPSCSVPGSCCCGDDCSCEGCMVHGNATANDVAKILPNDLNVEFFNNLTQFNSTPAVQTTQKDLVFNILPNQPIPYQNNQTILQPQLPNQPKSNKSLEFYTNFLMLQLNQSFPDYTSVKTEEESPISNPCVCPPDNCDCNNCETHGIINGLKLDEFFSTNFDLKTLPTRLLEPESLEKSSCCSNSPKTIPSSCCLEQSLTN